MNKTHKILSKLIHAVPQFKTPPQYLILTTYKNIPATKLQQLKLATHTYAKLQLIKTTAVNILTAKTNTNFIKNTTLACHTNKLLKTLTQLSKLPNITIRTILTQNKPLPHTYLQILRLIKSKADLFAKITHLLKQIIITLIKLLHKIKNEHNKISKNN
ncbi:hypothetical protein ACWNX2_00025 [Candidatus Vidania fulgoroideorum]